MTQKLLSDFIYFFFEHFVFRSAKFGDVDEGWAVVSRPGEGPVFDEQEEDGGEEEGIRSRAKSFRTQRRGYYFF